MKKLFYFFLLWILFVFLNGGIMDLLNNRIAVAEEIPKKISNESPQTIIQKEKGKELPEERLSVTHHVVHLGGRPLEYTATAGRLAIKDESGKIKAHIFFVAYTKDGQKDLSRRPITFAFNGGPGAASVFLHLGALGPTRFDMTTEEKTLVPPYAGISNEQSWLDFTDLVFIDPVGTGYSRPAPGVDPKEFYGVQEDIHSVGDFIRLYVTQYGRWLSPKFIAGESYGTTRAAGLSGYLQNQLGMYINGLILISSVLNFQTTTFAPGNDLPYILYLPAYTHAAWFHKKLSPELQGDLAKTRAEVEKFALNEYTVSLMKGDLLTEPEKNKIIDQLARYTGLTKNFIRNSHLRIPRDRFLRELLRDEQRRIGVLDSRITGSYEVDTFLEDPSVFKATGAMVAVWNDLVKTELKYDQDIPYEFLSTKANESWNWGSAARGYVDVAETLGKALSANRSMRVMIGSGYYDLDTSYFAAKYAANHLGLGPSLREHIRLTFYEAGHQMYTHYPSLVKLKSDAAAFVRKSLARNPGSRGKETQNQD